MAMKLPPKNYDNDLNRRKQGLDQIAKNEADIAALQALPVLPTPAAGDVGKVPKVNSSGEYELATDEGMPSYTSDDIGSLIQLKTDGYKLFKGANRTMFGLDNTGSLVSIYASALRVTTGTQNQFAINGAGTAYNSLSSYLNNYPYPILISDGGTKYYGICLGIAPAGVKACVVKDNDILLATISLSDVTYTPLSNVTYLNVTVTTGLNTISLPDSMTYDDLKASLDVGTVYIVDDDTNEIYAIEKYDSSSATFRHISISTAYVLVDSIEFNNLGGTYSQARVEIYTSNP